MLDQDTNVAEKSLPNKRWMVKAAEWNPELSSRYKAYRAIGRPRKRCEDNINEFLKLEKNETENSTESETIMDQSSKRPWKMDSTWKRLHNDCRRKI